jgi:hypothetical protein
MTTAAVTYGASDSANFIADLTQKSREHIQRAETFGKQSQALHRELCSVAEECAVSNWDGYQAMPVEIEAYRNAYTFIEVLPPTIPAPTIGAEPDGQVTIEWYVSPTRTVSISIDRDGFLHYAALFGVSSAFGTEPFLGELPSQISHLIARLHAK